MSAQELTTQGLQLYGSSTSSTVADLYKTAQDDLSSADTFMTLLMAQMQNQDPLNPLENQEFVSQLAQISSVEQLRTANSNLQMLQLYNASINNAQSVSLIGKYVKASGNGFSYDGDGSVDLAYTLDAAAGKVTVTIYSAEGSVVKTIELAGVGKGECTVAWDGTNQDGSPMEEGEYTYKVAAEDTSGNAVAATTFVCGVVDSITFKDGAPVLKIGSHEISMGDILEIETSR